MFHVRLPPAASPCALVQRKKLRHNGLQVKHATLRYQAPSTTFTDRERNCRRVAPKLEVLQCHPACAVEDR